MRATLDGSDRRRPPGDLVSDGTTTPVTVYWRPGCPYCSRLLGDLDRIGLPVRKVDIWRDSRAAARVRAIADGNETVPTVVVGDEHTMVNPRAPQVVDAVRTEAPGLLDTIDKETLAKAAAGPWHAGLGLAALFLGLWLLLALGNPETPYHLASAVVAAAWPVGRRLRVGRALPVIPALTTALGGGLVALIGTAVLTVGDAPMEPAMSGSLTGLGETLVGVALGTLTGAVAAVIGRHARARP